jgi:glyoxylase-like metal-dependent hydrolase (beta-lactamase superfamily II)
MKNSFFLKCITALLLTFNSIYANAQSTISQPGYYGLQIGSIELIALSDGTVPVSAMDLFHEAEQPEKVSHLLLQAHLNDPVEVSINAYLIKLTDKLILVDAGAGHLFGPAYGGKLISSLQAAGYQPEQITDILITHVHLDHSGGLTNNDTILFPNAIIHLNKKEIDFWLMHCEPKKDEMKGITSARSSFLALKRYLDKGKVKTFEGNVNLFPGVSTREYAGHTPGHTVFILESKHEKLVFWGDLIHIADIQLHGPDMYNGFDFDKQQAVEQRKIAYSEAVKEGYLIAADHISFPGIGRVRQSNERMIWQPIPYSLLGRTR